jgi:predicted nucleic acid-binding protein
MEPAARLFVDTSALFSGPWSSEGGARALLQLGEARLVQLVVSPDVLRELESVCRRKAPGLLGLLALTLDHARLEITPAPTAAAVASADRWVRHAGDARVVAAAVRASVDFLVTLDRAHLLGNASLAAHLRLQLGTPGDALAWLRARWGAPGA